MPGAGELPSVAESLLGYHETVAGPIAAAVAGYLAELVEVGFSRPAAEAMAVDYHAALIRRLIPEKSVNGG